MERSENGEADDPQNAVPVAVVVGTDDKIEQGDPPFESAVRDQKQRTRDGSRDSVGGPEMAGKSSRETGFGEREEGVLLDADVEVDSAPPAESFEPPEFEGMTEPREVVIVDNSGVAADVTESGMKSAEEKVLRSSGENGASETVAGERALLNLEEKGVEEEKAAPDSEGKTLPFLGEAKAETSPAETDSVSEGFSSTGTKILPVSHEKKSAEESSSSSFLDSAPKQSFDGPLQPAEGGKGELEKSAGEARGTVDNPAAPDASSGVQPVQVTGQSSESENPQSKERQPIISMPTGNVHPTSWRSCCGLFDALRRSNS